jgi:hypothetical protein
MRSSMSSYQEVKFTLVVLLLLSLFIAAPAALAHDPGFGEDSSELFHRHDPAEPLNAHDTATASMVISDGPFADVIKNLAPSGRGERLESDATTDVWVLGSYAYTGTFDDPCGGEDDAGIFVWDVHNHNKVPDEVAFIASPEGSRSNDVKVATMNSGDILVHSNESCGGGPGGFEIYNVDDPINPDHLASVTISESDLSQISPLFFAPGSLDDVGVHNLFLFTQGDQDYVAAVAETAFDNHRIYKITDPSAPELVSGWGAEEIFDPGVGDLTLAEDPTGSRTLATLLDLFSGFGSSQNKFLHDITISADGTRAYLSNWDAGLVLLDISDPADPQLVSIALDPVNGSLDGEVNSHAAWPSEDGSVVVETEEDFDFQILTAMVDSGPLAGSSFDLNELSDNDTAIADVAPLTGEAVFVGQGCNTDVHNIGDPSIDPPGVFDPYLADATGKIAVVRRGNCSFFSKVMTAGDNGAIAVIIADNTPGGTAAPGNLTANNATAGIPALSMSTVAGDAFENNSGNVITVGLAPDPWGGVRIWDYSDPNTPVLASTFDTVNSVNESGAPDSRGTYSVHNVIVEGNKAYISWYSDGVLILDISDPYNPVETARFHREGPEFEAENGGIQDFWGIYKITNSPWIYASDRNGGLYVLKEFGSGSEKQGQN